MNSLTVVGGWYRRHHQPNIPSLPLLHLYNFAEFRTNRVKSNDLTPKSNMYKAGKSLRNPTMILWFMVLNDSLCRHQYFELFFCLSLSPGHPRQCALVILRMDKHKMYFIQKAAGEGRLGGSVGWVSAFGSGHDPRVLRSSSALGSLLCGEPAYPSHSACHSPCLCSCYQINFKNL